MAKLVELLGENLIKNGGESVKTSNLSRAGEVVGLYFSAHWCPPCRGFTPKLEEFYHKFRTSSDQGKGFEIVFVSSDRDDGNFKEYFAEMPWLALPFTERDRKARISKKFKVDGIPTFILLDAETGDVICRRGRDGVLSDPEGERFPWRPKSVGDLLSGKALRAGEEVDLKTAISGKMVGLYFSAHWCPPCRAFTPKLVDTYNKVKEAGFDFEMIFVSADRSAESFKDYSQTMPWLSLPFEDSVKQELPGFFEVQGIPSLVILDQKLELITKNGRAMADQDPEGKEFPWHPQPMEKLTDSSAITINEMACMILFTGGDAEWVSRAPELMRDTAHAYKQALDEDEEEELTELCFLYETPEGEELADSVSQFAMLDDKRPLLVLLDVPEQKKHVNLTEPITKEVIQKLADDFRSGKLEMTFLQS